jgi:hypothetical protein
MSSLLVASPWIRRGRLVGAWLVEGIIQGGKVMEKFTQRLFNDLS